MHGDPLGLSGTILGGHDVGPCVAAYGSRMVYRAEHRALGLPARIEAVTAGDQQRRAFVRAGATVAKLSSRFCAIAQVHDGGMYDAPTGPIAYIVSEWIEGPTLAEAVSRSGRTRFEIASVIEWMEPVLDAMVAAHRDGVVHGHFDLHAFNVLGTLGPRASLKIDGLVEGAWRPQLQGGAMPQRSPAAGFGAPELGSGDTTLLGPWTDVYSLAAVLSVLLCGSSSSAMRERGLPAGVHYAFDKALNPRIDARFKTLAAFRASMMDGLPESARDKERNNPRRTMVVADVDSRMAEGSAGGFEVEEDDDHDAHKPTLGKARVRLAYTQPAMNVPEALANLESPPSGANPVQPPTDAGAGKQSSGNFVVVLVMLLFVAVGGGVAVGYMLFR